MRPTNGVNFLASYTSAHAKDHVSGLNIGGEPRPVLPVTIGDEASFERALAFEWGDALFDVRHRFVVSFGAELPTPRGMGAVVEHLLGGWQLNGIVQKQTGFPVIGRPTRSLDIRFLTNRPDATCDPNDDAPHTVEQWFNTSCFVRAPAGADRRPAGQRRAQHDPRPGLRVDRPVALQEHRARPARSGSSCASRRSTPSTRSASTTRWRRSARANFGRITVGPGRPRDPARA